MHLLSLYNPGRLYLMAKENGLHNYAMLAQAGQFGPHYVNDLFWCSQFAGGQIPVTWKKGHWNHFALTWNANESHGYLNGRQVGSGGPLPDEAGNDCGFGRVLQIGGYQRGRFMNGSLDELAAWKRMLSAREVRQVYNAGAAGTLFLSHQTVATLRARRTAALRLPEITAPNVFRNGSFEAGLSNYYYAENPYFAPPKFFPNRFAVSDQEARHGRRSLRITIPAKGTVVNVGHYGRDGGCNINTFGLQLNPDQVFTFSCWVKKRKGGPIKRTLGCYPVRTDSWRAKVNTTATFAAGETDWQRLVVVAKPDNTAHGYYTLFIRAQHEDDGEAVLYLDGLQVSPGEEAAKEERFPSHTDIAGTLDTPVLANLFKRGEQSPQLGVVLANQADETRQVRVSVAIYDLYDRKVHERDLAATLKPFEQHRVECALPPMPYGSHRAVLSTGGENGIVLDELSMSVMPDLGRVDCVGVHCFLCEYGLDVAARFGAQWNRLWDGAPTTKWYEVQPDGPDTFDWNASDLLVGRLRDKGFEVLGVLYHVQSYRTKHWVYGEAGSHYGRDLLGNEKMIAHWNNYVRSVVSRYKGKITYWELLNEPYNDGFGDWSPEEYLRLLEITEPVIRQANPKARIVGPCTYLGKWCPPMLDGGLLDRIDVFSYHGYGMGNNALATMRRWARHGGKELPVSDTENGCRAASKFFCKSYAGREYSAGLEPLASAANMSQAILRARVHGTDVVFQYWMRPYPPYSKHGSLLYCDGTPTPGAVAFGITGWMLEGYRERRLLRLGRYVDCAVFEDAQGRGLAALWDYRPFDDHSESTVILQPDELSLEARDFMGNPRKLAARDAARIITLHTDPIYIAAPSADELEKLLHQAQVR